jgi:predicted RNase H-like HicB family nuclease
MNFQVSIVVEKDDYGYYAFCPDLEGCLSQGETLEEVLENMREAIELYLETMSEKEKVLQRRGKNLSILFSFGDLQSIQEFVNSLDNAAADAALEEPGESIPWEQVKKDLSIK